MLCDNCIKINVCKHREKCNILERQLMGNKVDEIFTVKVECKEYYSNSTATISFTSSAMPAYGSWIDFPKGGTK